MPAEGVFGFSAAFVLFAYSAAGVGYVDLSGGYSLAIDVGAGSAVYALERGRTHADGTCR